ncbi:4'-phosphopantetheinyl transferase superfamily protein [Tissierella sp.]|uniref:4'-phosphopantetheinyl transferase family protein n=1 Tax=Tissierella sp. TaxID=41274 RepID=UPI0030526D31
MIDIYLLKIESTIKSDEFIMHIAEENLNIPSDKLIIERNKYGKPFFLNYPNIHYNISHTRGRIVCAISNRCIGIDVEKIRGFNRNIPKKFFTKNEQKYIFSKEEDINKRFFEIWTKKEAYVKWLGKGLEIQLSSFDVMHEKKISTISFEDYVISVCSNIPKIQFNWILKSCKID